MDLQLKIRFLVRWFDLCHMAGLPSRACSYTKTRFPYDHRPPKIKICRVLREVLKSHLQTGSGYSSFHYHGTRQPTWTFPFGLNTCPFFIGNEKSIRDQLKDCTEQVPYNVTNEQLAAPRRRSSCDLCDICCNDGYLGHGSCSTQLCSPVRGASLRMG